MMILMMAALFAAQDVPHNELTETLASEIDHTVTTTKRPIDLELCVGGVVSVIGTPTVLRNGDRQTVIASFSNGGLGASPVLVTATMTVQDDQSTRIDIRVRGRGWDERMRDRIATCAAT